MANFLSIIYSKFFFKVFSFAVVVVLMSSLTISLLIYDRFNSTMSKQNMDFVRYTSEQVKSNIENMMNGYEVIAANIYSDSTIQKLLKDSYNASVDYGLFEKFNFIKGYFDSIRNNNKSINRLAIYKMDSLVIEDGIYIRNQKNYREDLFQKALDAQGRDVWTAYYTVDDENKPAYRIALLKHLNVQKPGGVLTIEIKEDSFFDLYNAVTNVNYKLYVFDEEYNIITSNQRESLGGHLDDPIIKHLGKPSPSNKLQLDGSAYYTYGEKLKSGWTIAMLYNSFELEKEKRYNQFLILSLTVVFIFVSLLISLYFAQRFALQVDKLLIKIREIEKGNLNIQPSIEKVNEFYILDKTLCKMAHRVEDLTEDITKALKQKEESEIKYLQMQMNPHFLYNLLSAVRWIALHSKQEQIVFIVDHLSNFYKIALSKGNEIISIENEISLVKSYVALQNLCYDNMIWLNVFIDEGLAGLKVCKMTVQPFVENSVVHGRIQGQPLNISISVEKLNNMVRILIEDDGTGMDTSTINYIESLNTGGASDEKRSYGIFNTISRLNLLYNNKVKIFASDRAAGTIIEILILD